MTEKIKTLVTVGFISNATGGATPILTVPMTRDRAAEYIRAFRKDMRPEITKTLWVERVTP